MYANGAFELTVDPVGRRLAVAAPGGRRRLALSLLSALDRVDAVDETLAVAPPEEHDGTFVVERRSTIWERAWLEIRCLDDAVELQACVRGRGDLADVRLLGGRSAIPGAPLGLLASGSDLPLLFSPNPEELLQPVRDLRTGAAIGVIGDGEPGRGRWLFTPAPLYLALGDDDGWVDLAVAAPVGELSFVELAFDTHGSGFVVRLDYDGHTRVEGEFRSPTLLLTPQVEEPYAGLRRHRDDLVARGAAPPVRAREQADWWLKPIFCGWGAQCRLEATLGGLARDHATQDSYDEFLGALRAHDVVPGIVVIDDKWQATYGANEPDESKWPDLPAWIAARHDEDRHVLLWWKAWDPEGLDPSLCVRNADGVPVALDPSNAETRDFLRTMVRHLLVDLDADGFKVDFTARTPAGRALEHAGGAWGIALLHELLATLYAAAKAAKPDALVVTHTPHPAFADVTDMIRLNDVFGGIDVVAQMTFRADVVRAAVPELPIDTDDWPMPDKRSWREFLETKPAIGVPSLYYATHVDSTGEPLEDEDYAALRRVWSEWEDVRSLRAGAEVGRT